jgi:RNA polymerase sigma-70 factor (ECF subfamily)
MFEQKQLSKCTDDAELIHLLREGDENAFTFIYVRYHKMLYALAWRYLKSQTMAEDVVQHVFVKLWEYRKTTSITINLRNYLYSMTKNYVLNCIRNEQSAITHNYRIAQSAGTFEENLFEIIEQKELMSVFYQAIKLLPTQKREVCLLKMDEKLSNQEIADKMKLSVNTVKAHYAQAIKLLRVYLHRMLMFVPLLILLQNECVNI